MLDADSMQIAVDGIVAEVHWRLAPHRRESVALLARSLVEDIAEVGMEAAAAGLRARRETDPTVMDALLAVLLGNDTGSASRPRTSAGH